MPGAYNENRRGITTQIKEANTKHQLINQAHQNNKAQKRGLHAPNSLPFPSPAHIPLSFALTRSPFQPIKTALFTPN